MAYYISFDVIDDCRCEEIIFSRGNFVYSFTFGTCKCQGRQDSSDTSGRYATVSISRNKQ